MLMNGNFEAIAMRKSVSQLYFVVLFLFVGGCQQHTWSEDEIKDIAADSGYDGGYEAGKESNPDIAALQSKISDLETENQRLETQVDGIMKYIDGVDANRVELARKHNTLATQVDALDSQLRQRGLVY